MQESKDEWIVLVFFSWTTQAHLEPLIYHIQVDKNLLNFTKIHILYVDGYKIK